MKNWLAFTLLLSIHFALSAQSTTVLVTEQFEGQPLRAVLTDLAAKYQLDFAYDEALLEGQEVSAVFEEVPLSQVLDRLLSPIGLDFQFSSSRAILIAAQVTSTTQYRLVNHAIINGQVKDAQSGAPLPYATIHCSENRGVTSDENGNFSIPAYFFSDTIQMQVQFLGYRSQQLQLPIANRPLRIEVELSPKVHAFEQITVLDRVPTYSNNDLSNAMIFRPNSGNSLPDFVGGKDLFRSLQMLPGISAHDDLSAGLNIRGAESGENLILLDGMTLFNTGHFFGIFSAINPNIIDKVSVYKNAFPIEYGAFTAGVVEMETNELKRRELNAGIEFNLLTSNAYLHSPLSEKMDFLIAGRITNQSLGNTTYFDLLNRQRVNPADDQALDNFFSRSQLLSVRPDFSFYDVNAKWNWQLSPSTFINANFYRGYDQYEYAYEQEFLSGLLASRVDNKETFSEDRFWSNNAYSLIFGHQWNQDWNSQLTLGHTVYESEGGSSSSLTRSRTIGTEIFSIKSNSINKVNNYSLNWKNTWQATDNQTWTFGYNWVRNDLDLKVVADDSLVLDVADDGIHQSLYADQVTQLGDWRLRTGLRATHYSGTNQFYFSPRIQLQYKVNSDWQLKSSWSLQNQFLLQGTYENRFGRKINYWMLSSDRNAFPVANSSHLMLGFDHQKNGFELDVEFFYNDTDGVVEQSLRTPGFSNNRFVIARASRFRRNIGDRRTIGVDVLLRKEWSKYGTWLAYTLSQSKDRYPLVNGGNAIPSENDRRHQLKWIHQYRWGKWDLSATYVYASGLTYTDLNKVADQDIDRQDLKPEDYISRLKDYHRVDIGLERSFKWKGLDANFGISVFNLFNFNNVKYLQYIYSIGAPTNQDLDKRKVIGTELELLGITPNLSFGIEF
ncbi:MAG: TonB-dependent receptor [Bacteroidota bacterium]